MSFPRIRMIALAVVMMLAVLEGCTDVERPLLVPATGKVVYHDQPLTAGAIIFYPDRDAEYQHDNPSSLLQLDGSFMMKTFPFGAGVAPGKYKVCLAPELASGIQLPDYANPHKTPWEVEVPDTGKTNIQLEAK